MPTRLKPSMSRSQMTILWGNIVALQVTRVSLVRARMRSVGLVWTIHSLCKHYSLYIYLLFKINQVCYLIISPFYYFVYVIVYSAARESITTENSKTSAFSRAMRLRAKSLTRLLTVTYTVIRMLPSRITKKSLSLYGIHAH